MKKSIGFLLLIIFGSILVSNILLHVVNSSEVAYEQEANAQTNSQSKTIESISTELGHEMIQKNTGNPKFLILDVRTPAEYADGHINNALNIDVMEPAFRDSIEDQDRNKTYIVYCRSGNRSSKAADMMDELGFQTVYILGGGIVDWNKKGYPVVK